MATYLGNRRTLCVLSGSSTPITSNDLRFSVNFYLESQSVANNTSYIRADLILEKWGGNAFGQTTGTITIDGVAQNKEIANVYWNYPAGTDSLGSLYWTVQHATDGTKTLTAPGTIRTNPDYEGFITRSFTFSVGLPRIARGTTISSFTFGKASGAAGLSGLRATWATAHSIDRIQYSLSGQAYTTVAGSGTSGSFNISGLTPNTQYSLKIRVRRSDNQIETTSGTLYATTYDYARVTGADSINDEGTPYMTFSNPSGAVINAHIGYAGVYIDRLNIPNTGGYVFELSTEERNLLRAACTGPSMAIDYIIATEVSGTPSYWHSLNRTFTITNANPIFNNFDYEDIGGDTITDGVTTVDLTGDNQTIIKGYSNLKATISVANKMEAIKGANPKEYQLVVGAKQAKVDYSDDNDVEMALHNIDNNVFIVYAIDSRNNSTQKQISPATYINYFKPTISEVTVSRQNNISTLTNLKIGGTFFNANFGAANNDLTATYQYKKTTSEEWIEGNTELTLTITDNNFSFDGLIAGDLDALGFDISESFEIRVKVEDLLTGESRVETLVSAKPNIALHQDGTSINAQYDETLGGALQVNGPAYFNSKSLLDMFYPVGTIYETTSSDLDTTSKMANYFGGTWQVYGAGRVIVGYNASETEFNTIGKASGSKTHTLTVAQMPNHKHFIYVSPGGATRFPDWSAVASSALGAGEVTGYAGNTSLDGGGQAHNNLQPYITVYRYRRTA